MRGWKIAPSEFWGMTPAEWWRIYEIEKPKNPKTDYAGTLTEADVERLERMMKNGNRQPA